MVGTSRLKTAARKLLQTCGSFSHHRKDPLPPIASRSNNNSAAPQPQKDNCDKIPEMVAQLDSSPSTSTENLCPICLDPLSYSTGSSPGQAIFTAQCSHTFHFACISSNVRHGDVTCPICRAHWTQLPRKLNVNSNPTDPILRILDDSIATFRVHRRSLLRTARYDDDDPIEPAGHTANHPRLHFNLLPLPPTHTNFHSCLRPSICGISSQHHLNISPLEAAESPGHQCISTNNSAYLCVKLAHQPATDFVLVASPNGPHLRLMKQSMALVVFSLRTVDRLAIVAYCSAAARVFPLRCMTSYGKRTALQVIDRLFYMGQADPTEGLKKGVKILADRTHKNLQSCILHLSDNPTRSCYHGFDMEARIPVHRFHIGYGYGTSNGFVMHEFEEFLARVLGGAISDIQLRIGEDGRLARLGELRGGEERRILLNLGESGRVSVDYSYIDSVVGECLQTGEILLGIEDKRSEGGIVGMADERISSAGCWDYHDTYMARRWAKHLHGYRL